MCAVNGLCDPFIFFCFCGCLQAYNCPCKILLMLKNTTNDEFQCQVFNIHNAAQMWAERKKRDGWLYSLRIWSESRGCDSVRAWTHWLCVRMWRAGGACLLIWAARASISQGSVESRCCADARLDVIHVRHLLMKFCLHQSGNEERWNASVTAQKRCIMSVVYPRGVRWEWCDWDLSTWL